MKRIFVYADFDFLATTFYDHDILTRQKILHKALTDICINSKDSVNRVYP